MINLEKLRDDFEKWKKQGLRDKYDPVLLFRIALLFFKFKKVFGFRRITNYLFRIYGIKINPKTTYRYMKYLGLASIIRRLKRKSKEDKNTKFVGDNLINRNFKAEKPFEKIFTDVTYLKIKNKWYHLSVTIDGCPIEI